VKSLVSSDLATWVRRLSGGSLFGVALPVYLLHAPVIALGLLGMWTLSRRNLGGLPVMQWNRLAATTVAYLLIIPGPASESRFLMPALPLLCLAAAAMTSPKELR
jgi:hypothetical protein